MTDKVIEKFIAGEYNSENGKRLFELDMSEIQSVLDKCEDRIYESDKGETDE